MAGSAGFGVDGVRVGHWTDTTAMTGCTVVELPVGAVASYEVRGGVPASRELAALEPERAVDSVDAVLLTGGSAFGLAAADGVMCHFERLGRGVATPAGSVPIVPALALYDLGVGDPGVRPTAEAGLAAARATAGEQVFGGRVGAGAGAFVGHWRGPHGRRAAGLGHARRSLGDLTVAALCAVNAYGDIVDPEASEDAPGDGCSTAAVAAINRPFEVADTLAQTTIGVIVTNASLNKTGCRVVAQGGHDGLARALHPPHTRYDGDALIAAATGVVSCPIDVVRLLALLCVAEAIQSVRTIAY